MNERADIIEKIIKLRALGEGSESESEAYAAIQKAESLMHAYRIEEAELAMSEATGEVQLDIIDRYSDVKIVAGAKGKIRHKVQMCLWNIAQLAEVKMVLCGNSSQMHIIGDRADVEYTEYLTDLVREAMDREYASYRRKNVVVGGGAKASFQMAMARRINQRLMQMVYDRDKERAEAVYEAAKLLDADPAVVRQDLANANLKELTSTALVITGIADKKNREVEETYRAAYRGARLGKANGFGYSSNGTAYSAGRNAGDRVNFGRPVGSKNAPRLTS